jgi:hypothetical protein
MGLMYTLKPNSHLFPPGLHLFRVNADLPPTSLSSTTILAMELEPGRAVEGRYSFSSLMDEASGQLRLKVRRDTLNLGDSTGYEYTQNVSSSSFRFHGSDGKRF